MNQDITNPQSLLQLLNLQLSTDSLDYYAMSLVHSRKQPPTLQILNSLKLLAQNNDKWIEVARRLSDQSQQAYEIVSQVYAGEFIMYRAFISSAFLREDNNIIGIMKQSMLRILNNGGLEGRYAVVFFETFSMLLQRSVDFEIDFFIPFFSQQSAHTMITCLSADNTIIDCMIKLTTKFIVFQRKNMFNNKFKQNYSGFNHLTEKMFQVCTQSITPMTLLALSTLSQKPMMYDLFHQNTETLINICQNQLAEFNLIFHSKFQSEPQQMINYEDDLISYQRSQTVYTEAARLIQTMNKNIDGMLASFFRRNIQKLRILFINPNQTNTKQKLEILYLELLIISKDLKGRMDLIQELTEFLGDYFDFIFVFRAETAVINQRLLSLIVTYITEFPAKCFQQAISFLFKALDSALGGFVLRLYRALQSILEQKNLHSMINPTIQSLAPKLIDLLQRSPSHLYFQIFGIILDNYDQICDRYFSVILTAFTKRLHVEVRQAHSKGSGTTPTIKQIYRCIKVMFKKPYLLEQLYDTVEPILMQHALYLTNSNQIEFEEYILDLAAIIIKTGKTLTQYVLYCLKQVKGVYMKNKDVEALFQLFYSLCVYSTNSLLEDSTSVIFMVNILLDYFKEQIDQNGFWTIAYNRACVLFQVIIQNLQPLFVEGDIRQRVINELLDIFGTFGNVINDQFMNILISLFYISPFNLHFPEKNIQISSLYNNKMRSLYYVTQLKRFYTEELLQESLRYYKKYTDHHSKPRNKKVQHSNNIQESKADNYQNHIENGIDIYQQKYIESLKLPLMSIDDLHMFSEVIKQLRHHKKIDMLELSQEQIKLMEDVKKITWVGKGMRTILKTKWKVSQK